MHNIRTNKKELKNIFFFFFSFCFFLKKFWQKLEAPQIIIYWHGYIDFLSICMESLMIYAVLNE